MGDVITMVGRSPVLTGSIGKGSLSEDQHIALNKLFSCLAAVVLLHWSDRMRDDGTSLATAFSIGREGFADIAVEAANEGIPGEFIKLFWRICPTGLPIDGMDDDETPLTTETEINMALLAMRRMISPDAHWKFQDWIDQMFNFPAMAMDWQRYHVANKVQCLKYVSSYLDPDVVRDFTSLLMVAHPALYDPAAIEPLLDESLWIDTPMANPERHVGAPPEPGSDLYQQSAADEPGPVSTLEPAYDDRPWITVPCYFGDGSISYFECRDGDFMTVTCPGGMTHTAQFFAGSSFEQRWVTINEPKEERFGWLDRVADWADRTADGVLAFGAGVAVSRKLR